MKRIEKDSNLYKEYADYIKTIDGLRDGYYEQFSEYHYPIGSKTDRMRLGIFKIDFKK